MHFPIYTYKRLQPGDALIVRFGRRIKPHYAVIMKHYRGGGKYQYGRVWLHETKKWSKRGPIYIGQIIRSAVDADETEFSAEFGPAWERD